MITLTPPHQPWQHRRPGRRGFPKPVARRILQRDPICTLRLPGCTLRSTQADHTLGWADALARGWTPEQIDHEDNGRGVCEPCHAQVTQRQATRGRQRAAAQRQAQRTTKHPGLL